MKTVAPGRWSRYSSSIEETVKLWRVREDFDRGRATKENLQEAQLNLTERFLALQKELGVDMVSNGGFYWDSSLDVAREINGCSGFNVLHRIPETNNFHRAPEIVKLPKWERPILMPEVSRLKQINSSVSDVIVSLPGPYTLARQSKILNPDISFSDLVLAYAEALHAEINFLLFNSSVYVRVDDPQILLYPEDEALIRRSYQVLTSLAHPRDRVLLSTWFHRLPVWEDFFRLPFGGFFLDFTSGKETLLGNSVRVARFPRDKILAVGIVDGRQSAIVPNENLLFWLWEIRRWVPLENLWLACSTDLTFLPWDIAVLKLQQLVSLKKEVQR